MLLSWCCMCGCGMCVGMVSIGVLSIGMQYEYQVITPKYSIF